MPGRNSEVGARLNAPEKGAVVRMYNTGFGDCFLLAFLARNGEQRYVLIDCGVHQRWAGKEKRLKHVAQDIARATGNHLHIVAVTHEHVDHISGFLQGESSFQEMEIDELWLAWTEDPADRMAQELKRLYGARIRALRAAIASLKAAGNPLGARLEGVMGFDLPLDGEGTAGLRGNAEALKALRAWSRKPPQRSEDYRTPGEKPLLIPDVDGVKCYVLGPPKDRGLLKKLVDQKEMYARLAAMEPEAAFMAAALAASEDISPEDREQFDRSDPFDRSLMIPEKEALSMPHKIGGFFKEHYGSPDDEEGGQKWRQIGSAWLEAADELALAINSLTNNTSLVLAFELTGTKGRRVLLFAGDAQVGNWLSWQRLQWSGDEAAGKRKKKVTGAELLSDTVFYKVGHHGSINATLREKGLEMMKSRDLVAMIPVDEQWARVEMTWDHPAEKLVCRLMEKARGRVLRSDRIPVEGALPMPPEAIDEEWKSFQKNVKWDRGPERLWIQYTVQ